MSAAKTPVRRRASGSAPPPEPSPAGGFRVTMGVAALVYLGLALVYFLPAFLPGRQIFGTDYLSGSYPFYHFIVERLQAGELPKWVPYVFGGMPLSANPGSTFHPVLLAAGRFMATERVFALLFVVHFWLAGLGMYALARELGCRGWVALVAGLAFEFTGILASWVYAGHDGRVIAASMIAAAFCFLHRGVRTGRVAPFAGLSACLGVALLSFQIQGSYYLLLATAIWGVFCTVRLVPLRKPAAVARVVGLGLGAVALAFALAAVDLIPFLDYVPVSPRGAAGGRGYEYATSYSMPPSGIVAMAVPEQPGASIADPESGRPLFPAYSREGGFKLHTEYVGAWALLMLGAGLVISRRNRYWQFFAGLSLFGVSMALGGYTPVYRLYHAVLPGLDKFRAPDLVYYVVAFSVVAMAALTLERLAELRATAAAAATRVRGEPPEAGPLRTVAWVMAGIAAAALLGAMFAGAGDAGGGPSRAGGWMRFFLFAAATAGIVVAWTRGRIGMVAAALLLSLVTVADLWVIGKRFFHTAPPPGVVFAADDVVDFLKTQPGPYRVWTLPVPQGYRGGGAYGSNYLMVFGVDQVAGEHPNPLQRWDEYLGEGTRTYIDWHRFLRDPRAVATPQGDAVTFESVPGFLAAANVRYIISMAPLALPGLREVYRGTALVYQNDQALPRAYLVPAVRPVPGGQMLAAMEQANWNPSALAFVDAADRVSLPAGPLQGQARVAEYTPDRIVIDATASRPALLVLADNFYPGWAAQVNGRSADVLRVNHTFRGVVVPAGSSRVTLTFAPRDLYTGLYISLAAAAVLAVCGLFALVRGRAARDGAQDVDGAPATPEPGGSPA